MQNLVRSSGWKKVVRDVNEKIIEIDKEILEDISPVKNKLEYTEYDLMRCKRQAYTDLLSIPSTHLDDAIEMEDL